MTLQRTTPSPKGSKKAYSQKILGIANVDMSLVGGKYDTYDQSEVSKI